MTLFASYLKCVVTALAASLLFLTPALAEDDVELDALFEGLRGQDPSAAMQIEARIYDIWSKSGSASMDLLLERGRKALNEGDTILAVEHFTALIDHAPEFAEGYNARATSFFQDGKYGLALADIQQTLSLNPRHFGAMSGLALILEEIGRPEDALEAWREVEAIHPHREGLSDAVRRLETQVEGAAL
jgi:tetratricopeptide (TPR) repeat protein